MKGSLIMQQPVRDDPQAIQTAAGKDEVVVNIQIPFIPYVTSLSSRAVILPQSGEQMINHPNFQINIALIKNNNEQR